MPSGEPAIARPGGDSYNPAMELDSKGQHETWGQLSVRERIETLSDQFEGAWAAQGRPRIEDFLGRLPFEQQAPLFRQLLEIELSLRQQHGDNPLLAEYQSRFPQVDYMAPEQWDNPSGGGHSGRYL